MGNWGEALTLLRIAAAAAAVLLLPGYAGLRILSRLAPQEVNVCTVLGLSLALHPLVALWMTVAQVRLSEAMLWVVYLGCGALALASGWRSSCMKEKAKQRLMHIGWLTGLLCLVLVVRFVQIRGLVVPAWVDSQHHVLIVRLITEQGQIPASFEPYIPVPFFYHFGFHVLAAAFGRLADLDPPRAVLILGQILNAGGILAIYQLALACTRRRAVGLVAAAFAGLVSQMPAYYVSWGRYALLTGMVILPVVITVALEVWQKPRRPNQGVLLAVLTGGLILTHYIAAVFYAVFFVVLVLFGGVGARPRRRFGRSQRALWLLIWSILGIGIISPWYLRALDYVRPRLRLEIWSARTVNEAYFPNYAGYLWYIMRHARNWVLLFLALPGVIFAVARQRPAKLLAVWALAMLLLFNSWWWRIRPVRIDLVLITLFVPVSVLAGYALIVIQRQLRKYLRVSVVRHTALITTTLLCVWGVFETRSIVNPVTVLAKKADADAIAWIKEEIPQNARFLINVEPWWYRNYRGTDGGWWISLLAAQETILPPFSYIWGAREYICNVAKVAEQVLSLQGCDEDLWNLIEQQSITHIYIGVNGGILQASWFEDCSGIWPIYERDGVRIYEIRKTNIANAGRIKPVGVGEGNSGSSE